MKQKIRALISKIKSVIARRRFAFFIASMIFVATILVSVSMYVYYSSGAYSLDLSRPEYKERRSEIKKDSNKNDVFDESGEITDSVLDDFLVQFRSEEKQIKDTKAFQGEVLSDEELGISEK